MSKPSRNEQIRAHAQAAARSAAATQPLTMEVALGVARILHT
ncbi:hypothetical protein [Blastococcus montanus]